MRRAKQLDLEVLAVTGARFSAQHVADERYLCFNFGCLRVERSAGQDDTGERIVSRGAQGDVHDTGGRGEGVGLRGNSNAHASPTSYAVVGYPSLPIEIQALDSQISGLLRTEPPCFVLRVKTDVLKAYRRAESILRLSDRVLAGALRGSKSAGKSRKQSDWPDDRPLTRSH